jgi:hypothetical protein
MKIYPISSCIRRALPGLVLFISLALSGAAFAQQTASGPSLEETIAYINSHSSRTHSGSTTVSVSLDTSLLVVQYSLSEGTCNYTIPFRVLSQVKAKAHGFGDGTGRVVLESDNDNIHVRELMPHVQDKNQRDTQYDTNEAVVALFDDADQGERLNHALTRLISLLGERYQQTIIQRRDPNDPFK